MTKCPLNTIILVVDIIRLFFSRVRCDYRLMGVSPAIITRWVTLVRKAHIMITSPCNVYPLTPHLYIVKLGFTGVYINSLFLL